MPYNESRPFVVLASRRHKATNRRIGLIFSSGSVSGGGMPDLAASVGASTTQLAASRSRSELGGGADCEMVELIAENAFEDVESLVPRAVSGQNRAVAACTDLPADVLDLGSGSGPWNRRSADR